MSKKHTRNPETKRRLLKLKCGNTILSDVLTIENKLELSKPMEVVIMPDRSGKTLITLMDFIPGSVSEKVMFPRDEVLCTVEADGKLLALYEQATNPSPVEQVSKPGLLLPGA